VWAGIAQPAAAQAPLFSSDAPIAITIEGPIAALARAGPASTIARPATLTLQSGGAQQTFQISLSPRGIARRNAAVCAFPPLLIDFDRSASSVRGTVFQGQNKLKLVTHCRRRESFEQMAVLEYLAYRFYNLITPLSFRVRPVEVSYQEAGAASPPERHFGFLIEDVDDVAKRNGRVELAAGSAEIAVDRFDPPATTLLALFQYMIGNLDWDYRYGPVGGPCCHNVKLAVRDGDQSGVVPIPYDFDFSGFVDAPYALPPVQVHIASVRTRFFRGRCRHNGELGAAASLMRAHRADFAALVAAEPRLSEARRGEAQAYLDAFFAILDDPALFDQRIARRCIR
jgi:hypothetical protein